VSAEQTPSSQRHRHEADCRQAKEQHQLPLMTTRRPVAQAPVKRNNGRNQASEYACTADQSYARSYNPKRQWGPKLLASPTTEQISHSPSSRIFRQRGINFGIQIRQAPSMTIIAAVATIDVVLENLASPRKDKPTKGRSGAIKSPRYIRPT